MIVITVSYFQQILRQILTMDLMEDSLAMDYI